MVVMMKAVAIDNFVKSYDELVVVDVPEPTRKEDEVLVSIQAAGVNFVDLLYARGKHQNNLHHMKPPFTLGLEFAGVVVSSSPGSLYPPGTRVFGGGQGSFASFISVPSSSLRIIPPAFSFAAASGISATAPVSYGALVTRGQLKKGETVLIHAAAGGLGLMAVQIAKAVGARVIATAGSASKLSIAKRFGADECIDYTQDGKDGGKKWWEKVLELTNGEGVDVVYDSVGLVNESLSCLKHKGRVLIVGFAGREGDMEGVKMNRVLLKQAQLIGYRFGESDRRYPFETNEIWKKVMAMIDSGAIQPTVYDQEYVGLERIPAAMDDLAQRKVWGKAVISLEDPASIKAKM